MTTTRILCPLDCGWHHDEDPTDRNFDFGPPFRGEWPPGVDPLAASLVATRLLLAEKVIREHMETHELIEWVQALQAAKQLLVGEKARQEAYEESVVGALNERNTRDCRRADTAEAQVARVRNFLEDMAGWCSPHGVAADYSRRGLDALDGIDLLVETEAEIDAAMAAGEPVEIVDLPELTAEDAVEAMQDMAGDLYRAEDRLAFVREMCDAADREQRQVTTEQVRAWTQYTGCGGVIVLPETDEHPAGIAIPPGSPDGRHGWAGASERLPDGTCPAWCPCHRFKEEQQ